MLPTPTAETERRNSVTGGHLTMNRFFGRPMLTVGAALLAAACANSGAAVTEKEDLLVSAGFVPKKAYSAARMATLKSLPPHQFVTRTINGGTRYLYADPTICGCIYVGDQKAYDQYRQKMAAVQTATDEQIRSVLSATPLPGESGL
jgi:hypothetical protein